MRDQLFIDFLEDQHDPAMALDQESNMIKIHPKGPKPYQEYDVEFFCKGLVQTRTGIEKVEGFLVNFNFPSEYLRRENPSEIITILWPFPVFHPNCLFHLICTGHKRKGTMLSEFIHSCHRIFTYQMYNLDRNEAMNKNAWLFARKNVHRFPVDDRPLIPRRFSVTVNDPAEAREVTP